MIEMGNELIHIPATMQERQTNLRRLQLLFEAAGIERMMANARYAEARKFPGEYERAHVLAKKALAAAVAGVKAAADAESKRLLAKAKAAEAGARRWLAFAKRTERHWGAKWLKLLRQEEHLENRVKWAVKQLEKPLDDARAHADGCCGGPRFTGLWGV